MKNITLQFTDKQAEQAFETSSLKRRHYSIPSIYGKLPANTTDFNQARSIRRITKVHFVIQMPNILAGGKLWSLYHSIRVKYLGSYLVYCLPQSRLPIHLCGLASFSHSYLNTKLRRYPLC